MNANDTSLLLSAVYSRTTSAHIASEVCIFVFNFMCFVFFFAPFRLVFPAVPQAVGIERESFSSIGGGHRRRQQL